MTIQTLTAAQAMTQLAAFGAVIDARSPGEFAELYSRLAKDHDGCISIHLGSQLSATAEAARVGAQSVEGFRVDVMDSETVTMPMAFLCRVAADCATLDEATAAVKQRIPNSRVLALLDTLRYIEMGGFDATEAGTDRWQRLWLRGGFPRSYLARSERESLAWRDSWVKLVSRALTMPTATPASQSMWFTLP